MLEDKIKIIVICVLIIIIAGLAYENIQLRVLKRVNTNTRNIQTIAEFLNNNIQGQAKTQVPGMIEGAKNESNNAKK